MTYLPLIALSLHIAVHSDAKVSSSQTAFALDPLLPGQFFETPSADFDTRNDMHLIPSISRTNTPETAIPGL